jgi:hypothetical protein
MPRHVSFSLFACALTAWCIAAKPAQAASIPSCDHDRARLLALDQAHFDQDLEGGWRTLAARPECRLVAADLLRDYRQAHGNEAGILYWHEGQVRASAGQAEQAIALMARSRTPSDKPDVFGWNLYVDATIAFLKQDRPALQDALKRLAAVPPLPGDRIEDGMLEVTMAGGERQKMRWPMNIDVVEGLLNCFGQPYDAAYGRTCRTKVK